MNKKTIIKNIFSSLLQQLMGMIYGFIVPILVIKKFGSEVNGLVSSINQFLSYIVLLEMGIGPVIKSALFKPIIDKNADDIGRVLGAANSFFRRIAYIFVAYILILCLVYPNFIDNYNTLYVVSLVLIISISRFFEYFVGMTYKMFLQADQKNYVIDYVFSITYIISLIIMLILIKLDCSIHIVKLVSALIYIIRPLLLKMYFNKKYGYKLVENKNYELPQKWDGLFHHIASVIQANTDVVILTIFSTLTNVSIYSVYFLVTNGIRTMVSALTNGIDAFFGKIFVREEENINDKFESYTLFFYSITTILLSCTLVLIIPFISIYTKDIVDVNYVQESFAYVLVFSEFVFLIRYPYSTIVYAKGHFKQTKNFSIVEPIVNIIISIIFVVKYGLIGVAIGTFISMFIRSFGFIIYGTRHLLNGSMFKSFKIIIISFFEMVGVFIIHLILGNYIVTGYFQWFIYAILVFIVITIYVLSINCLFYFKDYKKILFSFRRKKNEK